MFPLHENRKLIFGIYVIQEFIQKRACLLTYVAAIHTKIKGFSLNVYLPNI